MDGGLTPSVFLKIINIGTQIGKTGRGGRAIDRKTQRSTFITITQTIERATIAPILSPKGLRTTNLRESRGLMTRAHDLWDTHTPHF